MALVGVPDRRWPDPSGAFPLPVGPSCEETDRGPRPSGRCDGDVTRRRDDRPMVGRYEATRVGVCVVHARTDAPAQLLITVTARRDVDDAACETVLHTATVEEALVHVAEFLASVKQEPDDLR
jgi:hypothetical protein